ncbi:MAG: hypothetical protein JWM09_482 [Francisellaceae bacterium]|nr:hypothetical protein [Francisellaceae bacterium]
MKNKFYWLFLSVICIMANKSFSEEYLEYKTLFLGVDAQYRYMPFKAGLGRNNLNKNYIQGNIYSGLQLNPYIGLELGYEYSFNRKHIATVGPGENFLGINNPSWITSKHKIKTKIKGPHLDVLISLPLMKNKKINIVTLMGLSHKTIEFTESLLSLNGRPQLMGNNHFSSTKTFYRLGGGLRYFFDKNYGVKTMAIWEKASSLKYLKSSNERCIDQIGLKNQMIVSLGFFIRY